MTSSSDFTTQYENTVSCRSPVAEAPSPPNRAGKVSSSAACHVRASAAAATRNSCQAEQSPPTASPRRAKAGSVGALDPAGGPAAGVQKTPAGRLSCARRRGPRLPRARRRACAARSPGRDGTGTAAPRPPQPTPVVAGHPGRLGHPASCACSVAMPLLVFFGVRPGRRRRAAGAVHRLPEDGVELPLRHGVGPPERQACWRAPPTGPPACCAAAGRPWRGSRPPAPR